MEEKGTVRRALDQFDVAVRRGHEWEKSVRKNILQQPPVGTETAAGLEENPAAIITAGMEESKERLKQYLQSVSSVKVTKSWEVTDQGWVLKRLNLVDPQGERWNITLEGRTSPDKSRSRSLCFSHSQCPFSGD